MKEEILKKEILSCRTKFIHFHPGFTPDYKGSTCFYYGILDQNNKLISALSINEARNIINEKHIVGGMKPKISTCINAIEQGVKQATILDGRISHSLILELFTEHGIGTQIYS